MAKLYVILLLTIQLISQTNFKHSIGGFYIGQYNDVVKKELGEPFHKETQKDNSIIEYYYASDDSSAYMVFLYTSKYKEIYSIQLSGNSSMFSFDDIFLGSNMSDVIQKLKKPTRISKTTFGENEAEVFHFDSANYSILFQDEKVQSINVWNPYPETDENSLLEIKEILKILSSGNRKDKLEYLSAGMEIQTCDDVLKWDYSLRSELKIPDSNIFSFLEKEKSNFQSLLLEDSLQADLNLRITENYGLLSVYKFAEKYKIQEIVLRPDFGKYKIWEIKFWCK